MNDKIPRFGILPGVAILLAPFSIGYGSTISVQYTNDDRYEATTLMTWGFI